MPIADPEKVVTTARDGITVEKSFEPDDFPVPAIAFAIDTDRDESVTVRLVDTVPDDIAPENVGFHPKYGAEYWDVDGEDIVFEREFGPGEEYTTVYGLRGGDADLPAKFMSEPSIESVEPPLDSEDTSREDDSGRAKVDVDVGAIDLGGNDGLDDDESGPEGTDTSAGDTEGGSVQASTQPNGNSLLSRLTAEIESADPNDPEIAALRDALGINLARATVEARIEHLQSAVADLEAYTDAFEEFLDEEGEAQKLLAEIRDDYEETTERLDDVESIAEETSDSVESLDDRLETEVEDRLESELSELHSEIEAMESDIDGFSAELSEVVEMRDRLTSALGGLAEGAEISNSVGDTNAEGESDSEPSVDADSSTDSASDQSEDPGSADSDLDSIPDVGSNSDSEPNSDSESERTPDSTASSEDESAEPVDQSANASDDPSDESSDDE